MVTYIFSGSVIATLLAFGALAKEVPTRSPTSNVEGKAFNRFMTVWLENTDYDKAVGDPSLAELAKSGITLTNYFAVTHPSMPNYISAVSGDYYGVNHDSHIVLPQNISSIADLLEDKKISWSEYQEDMPYTGFEDDYQNPKTKANMYVRKHNPLIIHGSVSVREERLGLIKNTTMFAEDLKNEKLPQWMFVTPNMTSDGHDTSVTVAGTWTKNFLTPLLKNSYFMKDTLVLVTFDENHSYAKQNRVLGILLGGAVPKKLHGTTDDNYYDHYSELATVQANWGLHTLGRYDVGANVFQLVANKTGDKIRKVDDLSRIYLNESYPGIFNKGAWAPQPVPNTSLVVMNRTVLPSIVEAWGSEEMQKQTVYSGQLEIPSKANPPEYVLPLLI